MSMKLSRCIRAAIAVLGVAALVPNAAQAVKSPELPAPSPFWSQEILLDTFNFAFPDTGTTYWYDSFTLPAGAKVEFKARYPHSRYFSFNSYFTTPTLKGVVSDAIRDNQIVPDAGS